MIDDRKYREHYLHVERTAEQRRKDLAVAFDQIFELKCQLRSLKNRVWVLSGALAIAGSVIGWLSSHLYDCMAAVQQVMR